MYSCWFVRSIAPKLTLCACVVLLFVTGCNSGRKLPALVEVTGQVTLDGEPLTTGNVAFIPDSTKGTTGPISAASIDENGNFRLKTAGTNGAPVGWYTVTVEIIDSGSVFEDGAKTFKIPSEYIRPDASPLKKEVKSGEQNVINLELKSKV